MMVICLVSRTRRTRVDNMTRKIFRRYDHSIIQAEPQERDGPNFGWRSGSISEKAGIVRSDLYGMNLGDDVDNGNNGDGYRSFCKNRDDDLAFYEDVYEDPPLESNHPFQAARIELSAYAEKCLRGWQMGYRQSRKGLVHQGDGRQDGRRDELNTPGFACPYYRLDPDRYISCLKTCDLRTIKAVKQHLWNVHRQEPYCPTCRKTFNVAVERNKHIRNRACKDQPNKALEGITDGQRQLLAVREGADLRAEERWLRIWDIAFPKLRRPGSASLQTDMERAVRSTRVFWDREGQGVVADFLRPRGLLCLDLPDEERSLSRLHESILKDLIDAQVACYRGNS